MDRRILISGLGGSLFPYLNDKLVEKNYDIYYVDSNPELKFIYPNLKLYISPLVTEKKYLDFITTIIKKHQINIYVPLIDEELIVAKNIEEMIPNLKVLIPSRSFIELCLNKFDLMNKLNQLEISITKSYISSDFNWQIPPPVFLKPNIGRGSRGIKKVFSKSQYQIYKEENFGKGDILIQPIFSGIEYTVGVLSNPNNKIISISPKRVIRKNGITINAVTENNTIIDKLAIEITKHLEPRGPFNIQLFVTKENRPIVFEINPRFSTTLVLSIEAGIDEVDLLVNNYSIQNPKQYYAKEGVYLYRNWNNNFYKKN